MHPLTNVYLYGSEACRDSVRWL